MKKLFSRPLYGILLLLLLTVAASDTDNATLHLGWPPVDLTDDEDFLAVESAQLVTNLTRQPDSMSAATTDAAAPAEASTSATSANSPTANADQFSTTTVESGLPAFTESPPSYHPQRQQTAQPTQSVADRCSLAIQSNLYRCSNEANWWQSKADQNDLTIQLPLGRSETICCRDWRNQAIYSTLPQHRDSQIGSRMQINCSLALANRSSAGGNALTAVVTGADMHCYNLCNTTLSLGERGRNHYNLFLPIQSASDKCLWRLRGVAEVVISKSEQQAWNSTDPFLCLSDASRPQDCQAEFRFAQRYPLFTRSSEAVFKCRSGDCLLWYDWRAARLSLIDFNFRSFKVELFGAPETASPTLATDPTDLERLLPPPPPPPPPPSPQPPPPRAPGQFPLEFRVTRGVMAGVTVAAVALICAAACVWGYRSWHYQMYSSPLRRLLGRTPLHRLPTYSSRLYDLDRLQLDRPSCDAKEVVEVPSLSSSSDDADEDDDIDVEEIEMMMELEPDRNHFADTAAWRRV